MPIDGVLHTHAPDYHRRPENIDDPDSFCEYLASELDKLIEAEGPETVAAFVAEPITGAGGVFVPPDQYFKAIHAVLKKHDVLMIADEVITAFGRTGDWFAGPNLGMEPDLISVSKGITSGYLPLSACLISEKIADVLYGEERDDGMFCHGFTASGHSVCAAAALENINIIEREGLLGNAKNMGEYLISGIRNKLGEHHLVGDIRGKGLIIGIEFDQDRSSRTPFTDPARVGGILSEAFMRERLFVRGGHGRVLAALAPALILSASDADEIIGKLTRAVDYFATEVRKAGIA